MTITKWQIPGKLVFVNKTARNYGWCHLPTYYCVYIQQLAKGCHHIAPWVWLVNITSVGHCVGWSMSPGCLEWWIVLINEDLQIHPSCNLRFQEQASSNQWCWQSVGKMRDHLPIRFTVSLWLKAGSGWILWPIEGYLLAMNLPTTCCRLRLCPPPQLQSSWGGGWAALKTNCPHMLLFSCKGPTGV